MTVLAEYPAPNDYVPMEDSVSGMRNLATSVSVRSLTKVRYKLTSNGS